MVSVIERTLPPDHAAADSSPAAMRACCTPLKFAMIAPSVRLGQVALQLHDFDLFQTRRTHQHLVVDVGGKTLIAAGSDFGLDVLSDAEGHTGLHPHRHVH